MPEALVPSAEAIDRLLGTVRSRLEEALRNGQRVHVNAHAGTKPQVWRPGETNVVMEEDGSFSFTLWIEKKR